MCIYIYVYIYVMCFIYVTGLRDIAQWTGAHALTVKSQHLISGFT